MLVSSFAVPLGCSADDAVILVPEELLTVSAVVADDAAAALCTEACAVALCAAFIALAMRAAAAFFGVLAANLRSASFLRVSSAALVAREARCLTGALTLDITRSIAHKALRCIDETNTFHAQGTPPFETASKCTWLPTRHLLTACAGTRRLQQQ
jgi:hypothetical protein